MSRCYHCGHILEDKNAACPNCLPNFYGRGKRMNYYPECTKTCSEIKLDMKEIKDLRTQLEDYRDMVARYQDENAALTEKLEKAHMDVANAEHNVAENTKQEIMMWIDKCIALEQKLVAVREWADTRQADSVVKLRKILDGGESD